MKLLLTLSLLFLFACTSTKKIDAGGVTPKADEKVEGAVISKKAPKTIKGFRYVKSVNAYFRDNVSMKKQKDIVNKIKRKSDIKSDRKRFSQNVRALSNQFKLPFWADYFGDEAVKGTIALNVRVGKNNRAEIIIVESGINAEADRIFVEHATKFPFKSAIHKKSKKPVRAWIKLRNSF